ncbi:hypothetical protein LEN26_017375 [Aphanomyces euteiches]|nr:hypothetical protein LEN26_017375 [Aphanomyces euteiches]KAH9111185.1 hypothetical protein AeMF1_014226 [Aphanomyces euteiches]KAH9183856.1 hypothetical protein AeNC1_014169 [Aphanomyces euteiches]
MGRRPKGKGKQKTPIDVYEHDDAQEDLKEQRENDRMDIDGVYEYEAPDKISRDQDSEIDEDEAFNSEDEATYGSFFDDKKNSSRGDADSDDNTVEDDDEEGGDLLSDMLGTAPAPRLDTSNDAADESDDDDEEDEDDEKHASLMNMVDRMARGTKRKITHEETTEDVAPSAFSKKVSGSALTLEGLLGASMASLPGEDEEGDNDEAQHATSAVSHLKKQLSQLDKDDSKLQVPVAPIVEARATRKVAYTEKTQEMNVYQPVVKANREKETLDFRTQGNKKVENITVAALASKFVPEKPLENDVAKLLETSGWTDKKILREEEAELEVNQVSVEEVRARQGELAKMRAMMFYQEQKNKRIKKIKSKLYHKIRNKAEDRKERLALRELDPDLAAQMDAEDAEKRAEERMTLKHTNTSKWVKHQLSRGINADQTTRTAIADQLRRADELRKKMHSARDDEESDESDDEEDPALDGMTETEKLQHRLQKKAAALVMDIEADGENEEKAKGLHGMKFMKKAVEKQRERALEQAEALLKELRGDDYVESDDEGAAAATAAPPKKKVHVTAEDRKAVEKDMVQGTLQTKAVMMDKGHKTRVASAIKVDFGDNAEAAGEKTLQVEEGAATTDVEEQPAAAEENPWLNSSSSGKKRRKKSRQNKNKAEATSVASAVAALATDVTPTETKKLSELTTKETKGRKRKQDTTTAVSTDKETKESKESTPAKKVKTDAAPKAKKAATSQEELVRQAFAFADEGENDIQKEKELLASRDGDAKVGAEVAKLVGMEGWGSWAGEGVKPSKRQTARLALAQQKAKDAHDAALAKRKDSKMERVLINEKKDKKAAKFMVDSVPYPFTSREQYELAMRNPLGSDWNTTRSTNALTVPEVMTRAGKIIEPLRLTNEQKKGPTKELSKTAKQGKQRKAKF